MAPERSGPMPIALPDTQNLALFFAAAVRWFPGSVYLGLGITTALSGAGDARGSG